MFISLPSGWQMPFDYWRMLSARFWELGARPDAEPIKALIAPEGAPQSWMDPGHWEYLMDKPKRKIPTRVDFPLKETCNLSDPSEAFLWMFVAPPHLWGGPLVMSIDQHQKDSEHLWDCGVRPSVAPKLEYVPPGANDPFWTTTPGKWLPAGSRSSRDKARAEIERGIARMGHGQKVAFFQALKADRDGLKAPKTKAAEVVASMHPQLRRLALEVLQ